MLRKLRIILTVLTAFSLLAGCTQRKDINKMTGEELSLYAKVIHDRALTLDTHIDIEVTFFTPEKPGVVGYEKLATIPKMNEGGMDGAFFAVYVGQGALNSESYKHAHELAVEKMRIIHNLTENVMPEKVQLAYHPEDVDRIQEEGKKVVIIGLENGYPIGEDIENIKEFFDLGTRYITLSHNGHNQICDSNMNPGGPESLYDGFSPFGRKVIKEMNRLGIIIDVSHVSKKSMLDAVRLSKAPVIASHSGCRALCDESRNIDDEQLLALKKNGGVINIIAINEYIKKAASGRLKALQKLRKKFNFPQDFWRFLKVFLDEQKENRDAYLQELGEIDKRFPPANVKDYVDHIDHVVRLIGIDHVGIGSDYYSTYASLKGWRDASEAFHVTLELVRRGYSEEEIKKIWSGNLLRVWREVEKVAKDLRRNQN